MPSCTCPHFVVLNNIPAKASVTKPLNRPSYSPKCCGCIPLKAAAIFICIISFGWASCELHKVDKFVKHIFPEKNDKSDKFKTFYILWTMFYLLINGVFMLGIIMNKYHLVNLYICFTFLYVCVNFGIIAAGIVMPVWKTGDIDKKQINNIVYAVFWTCLFFYFLVIVNRFKMTLKPSK